MDISKNIKTARQDIKLTQSSLASMIGSSKSAMSEYESGIKVPSLSVIEEIAKVTKKPVYWFFMTAVEQKQWEIKDKIANMTPEEQEKWLIKEKIIDDDNFISFVQKIMNNEKIVQFANEEEEDQLFVLEILKITKQFYR
ncbi:helix-turn-helix transcriptional regulator [bacterium]|nr:helix-turn-helix transcriptional regulator [bacterium]